LSEIILTAEEVQAVLEILDVTKSTGQLLLFQRLCGCFLISPYVKVLSRKIANIISCVKER
jgi:hypothetical protein